MELNIPDSFQSGRILRGMLARHLKGSTAPCPEESLLHGILDRYCFGDGRLHHLGRDSLPSPPAGEFMPGWHWHGAEPDRLWSLGNNVAGLLLRLPRNKGQLLHIKINISFDAWICVTLVSPTTGVSVPLSSGWNDVNVDAADFIIGQRTAFLLLRIEGETVPARVYEHSTDQRSLGVCLTHLEAARRIDLTEIEYFHKPKYIKFHCQNTAGLVIDDYISYLEHQLSVSDPLPMESADQERLAAFADDASLAYLMGDHFALSDRLGGNIVRLQTLFRKAGAEGALTDRFRICAAYAQTRILDDELFTDTLSTDQSITLLPLFFQKDAAVSVDVFNGLSSGEDIFEKNSPNLHVFQYWEGAVIPHELKSFGRKVKFLTEYRLFDFQHSYEFIHKFYGPEIAALFDQSWHPAMQSDIFRLLYAATTNGLYLDADYGIVSSPLRRQRAKGGAVMDHIRRRGYNAIRLIHNYEEVYFNNDFIRLADGPLKALLLDDLVHALRQACEDKKAGRLVSVHDTTGPALLRRVLNKNNVRFRPRDLIDQIPAGDCSIPVFRTDCGPIAVFSPLHFTKLDFTPTPVNEHWYRQGIAQNWRSS